MGEMHSLCVDDWGWAWSWGCGNYGQLGGTQPRNYTQYTPKRIWFLANKGIRARECFAGSQNSMIISDEGQLYVFGANDEHQLGVNDVYLPTLLRLPEFKVKKVSRASNHTAIITL